MTKYIVNFIYTVMVDADGYEEAQDVAYDNFSQQLADLHASDFSVSDAEDATNWFSA